MSRTEVVRRLRSRSQPITLFGETEKESRARLRRLEIEQVSSIDFLKLVFRKTTDRTLNSLIH